MNRFDLKPDSVSLRTLLEFTAAARRIGAEIEVDRWLIRPYVSGVEVTQGIQYFGAERHLTNGDDRGADNSLRLIARKPAWVRVYVRSGLFGADQVLTGDLLVDGEDRTVPRRMDPRGDTAPCTRRGDIAARPRLHHRARHDRIIDQLRRRRRAHGRHGAFHHPHLVRRRCHADAHRHVAGDGRRHATADPQLRGVFVHYNGPDTHDQRHQSAHSGPARARGWPISRRRRRGRSRRIRSKPPACSRARGR